MPESLALIALAGPLAFAAVALAARSHPGIRPRAVERLGAAAGWLGVVVAAGAAAVVALDGAIQSPLIGGAGLGVAVRLDALSSVMLLMIALLAVVIWRFSRTYLDGDARHGVFLGRLAATIAAVQTLVIAGNLALLAAAWIATSLTLHQLLVFYSERRAAIVAARKKFVVARIGDALLLLATVVLYAHFDTGDLQAIFDGVQADSSAAAIGVAAAALVGAAFLKSAQFPTHGWLIEVMETPTPVSALLHAGILNAGPFLAMRMAYVIDDAQVATTLLLLAGGFTALFASIARTTQPSVKVGLAYSSAGHMGFSLMLCGLGVYPAALLHLVAHTFYKAHAFLSSGSVVDTVAADKVAVPDRLGSAARIILSVAVALGIYVAGALAWGDIVDDPVLLAIGAIFVIGTSQLVASALDSEGSIRVMARVIGYSLAVTLAFFVLEAGAHQLLHNTAPSDGTRDALHLGAIAIVGVAFAATVLLQILEPARGNGARGRALAVHFRNGLYANALFDRAIGALRIHPKMETTS